MTPLSFPLLGQLRPGQRSPGADSTARVRRHHVPQRDQVGPPELGGQWPHAALQEGLQAPAAGRPVPTGAAALGVLRPQEEADGEEVFVFACHWMELLLLHSVKTFHSFIVCLILFIF